MIQNTRYFTFHCSVFFHDTFVLCMTEAAIEKFNDCNELLFEQSVQSVHKG